MIRLTCLLVCFLGVFAAEGWCLPGFQRGMSYIGWSKNVLYRPESTAAIAKMKETGVDWVGLNVIWFQDNETSTVITEDFSRYSSSKPSLVKAIQDCHAAGMKVMLKPMVDLRNGAWRGEIVPSSAWFDAYRVFVVDWGRFAAENGVEMFCIGTELMRADSGTVSASSWRNIAAAVREVFPGPITYAANHGGETNVLWWGAVDFVGIDVYYKLTDKQNPTPQELITAWENRANKIEAWLNKLWPGKPLIFTEIGYRSYDGANREPWDWTKQDPSKVDLQEQADCYNAALTVLTKRPWFQGFYWWQWDTDPDAGGANHIGFTVQNKPAQDLLADWYLLKLPAGVTDFEAY